MGVDPGFANMGVSVLEWNGPGTPIQAIAGYVVSTDKKDADRVTSDDTRRMRMLWMNLEQTIKTYQPHIIGVEAYTVYKPTQGGSQGKGTGWKALFAYAMTCTMSFSHNIPLKVFMPTDLKRRVASKVDASKVDVERALAARGIDLSAVLADLPGGKHEHAADAAGHGLMALADYVQETCQIDNLL